MPELQELLASPLSPLFSFLVRQSLLFGHFVDQLLCRQLCSDNTNEIWFLFAGQPFRFSLIEFAEVTGLCCSSFPPVPELLSATTHADGSAPYWYTLIGRQLGTATVDDLVLSLKSDKTMSAWRKFRLPLVAIVEGILLCRTQPVKPSVEVVEMVKNVEFFLHYPWGLHSFNRIIRMVWVGDYIADNASLIRKLQQSSMDVHGFPLAIQLFAFRTIPALLKYLPHLDDHSTFLHQTVAYLPKCRAFHASNIFAVENDTTVWSIHLYTCGILFWLFFLTFHLFHLGG
ncbi:PREDICTED: uncharacterized protein LOC104766548 [Camelina sativa]|uniref:Uncharacterized protein LOC104766548 n=1 Tax=Camelina sativa TaxID=90675 RepID=A0ABM0XP19_CAMSA|nr:PREDICTED: uncharacterized protein LOC104766548 [Camelina sativa]